MRARWTSWLLWWLVLGCSVPFSDERRYTCVSDGDCGGDGFVCIADRQGVRACCGATEPELCGDGVDNDCDGLVDGEDDWPEELCNGQDEDCDGRVDEGFYFEFDDENCGACGRRCVLPARCSNWSCSP